MQECFLFKSNQLCVTNRPYTKFLIRETHCGGLASHFGVHKTFEMLKEHFYWQKMLGDVKPSLQGVVLAKELKLASNWVHILLHLFQSHHKRIQTWNSLLYC